MSRSVYDKVPSWHLDVYDRTWSNSTKDYPQFRYMGSKYRLLPWIEHVLSEYTFESSLDAFSGSGAVSYLLKKMRKKVISNDFLHFSYLISKAVIENSSSVIDSNDIDFLLSDNLKKPDFIKETFAGIFYTEADLSFLDNISANIRSLDNEYKRAVAYTALFRSCIKKQPRGVFTISGSLDKYDDGRRDLKLSIKEHFVEQVNLYNKIIFSNHKNNISINKDVFEIDANYYHADLVYMDPPYVPRSDDNCYVKRYHFLEGLSKYWSNEEILYTSKVKKIKKKYTPFSYRKTAEEAFDKMFKNFSDSILVLSYSSNGYPDLDQLVKLMKKYKSNIDVHKKEHRYHFGTHSAVKRAMVEEYLIIGT